MIKSILKFFLGLFIILCIYFISLFIVKLTKLFIPPAILALVLFALALYFHILKESWVEVTVNVFLKNMAMLFVPFIGGLIVYKGVLLTNWLSISLVVLLTTTITIVSTGLFVEYGIKYLRLHKMRKHND